MIDANVPQSKISNVAAAYILGKVASNLNEFSSMESIEIVRGLFGIKEEQPTALQITDILVKTIGHKREDKIRSLLTDQGVSGVIWRFVSSKMFMVELSKVLDNKGNFLSLTLITVGNEKLCETSVRELVRFNSKGVEYMNKKIRSIDYDTGITKELQNIRSNAIASLEAEVLGKGEDRQEEEEEPSNKEPEPSVPLLDSSVKIELTHNGIQAKEIFAAATELLEKNIAVAQIDTYIDALKDKVTNGKDMDWTVKFDNGTIFIVANVHVSAEPVKEPEYPVSACGIGPVNCEDYHVSRDEIISMSEPITKLLYDSLGTFKKDTDPREIVEKCNGILHEKTIKDFVVVDAKLTHGITTGEPINWKIDLVLTPEYLETAKLHYEEEEAKRAEAEKMKEVVLKQDVVYIYRLTEEEDEFEFIDANEPNQVASIKGTDPDCGGFTDGSKYKPTVDITLGEFKNESLVSIMDKLEEIVEPNEEPKKEEENMEETAGDAAKCEIIVSEELSDISEVITETLGQIIDEVKVGEDISEEMISNKLCEATEIDGLHVSIDKTDDGLDRYTVSQKEEEQDEGEADGSEDGEGDGEEVIAEDNENTSTVDINDRNYQMALFEGLFQTKDPAITHVERFLRNFHSESRTPSFLATMGTIPFQTPIVYDDVTVCFVKFKNGLFYRIYIAKTDRSLGRDGQGWVESRNIPGRWVQIGSDIQSGPNRGFRGRRY